MISIHSKIWRKKKMAAERKKREGERGGNREDRDTQFCRGYSLKI